LEEAKPWGGRNRGQVNFVIFSHFVMLLALVAQIFQAVSGWFLSKFFDKLGSQKRC
jgi:hypothetical protein